ncbi:hypothetical protein [Nonomuraea rubra]|uniref:Uncharacterized protein n=1 Tax=Nonomuraea rubra TaxID=46180 RepID=A0A7X0TWB2_9ACTN|nr:hypothetical protein [Nonomuraea rubra]MBB6546148.1 hypothetical protein [Nonomuraea rubra]
MSSEKLDGRLLWLIAVILLGGLLGILNSTLAAVATGTLGAAFDTSLSTIGWASTGFLLAVTATITGLRGVFWLAVVSNLVVLSLIPLLPGKAGAQEPVRREGVHA